MAQTLILGIGSPFGDDQFGFEVAKQLKTQLAHLSNIHIDLADRPGLNLLYWLDQSYDRIIVIDAVDAGAQAGTLFQRSAAEILNFEGFLSSHNIGIAAALKLAQALNKPIDHIVFYGAQAGNLSTHDTVISEGIHTAISKTVDLILQNEFNQLNRSHT